MRTIRIAAIVAVLASCISALSAASGRQTVTLREATAAGDGPSVGNVHFRDTRYGLLIEPDLHGLQPGPHAAHLHENGDCSAGADGTPAGAAGDHHDPGGSGVHAGPYGNGHLGDLPNLLVEADGRALIPVLAPRVRLADLDGRALMIHAGADRYDAHSQHLHGKGGSRMYCGVIG